jgi:hypothetical protein
VYEIIISAVVSYTNETLGSHSQDKNKRRRIFIPREKLTAS